MLSLIFTFIFAFIDPFVIIPAFVVGWFVKDRQNANLISAILALIIAVIMYGVRQSLGDVNIGILPFVVKIFAALVITNIAYAFRVKRLKKTLAAS